MPSVFVVSSKACGWTSRDLNKTALEVIPPQVYKRKHGLRATILVSTARESLAIKAVLIFVTCTVSQLCVLAHKRVCVYLHSHLWS